MTLGTDDRLRIMRHAESVFSINYKRHLKLFPNVDKVLEWADREGIVVVGLSDALERWVIYRLRALGILPSTSRAFTRGTKNPGSKARNHFDPESRSGCISAATNLNQNKEVVWKVLQDSQ